ncbi:hypothetical protein PRZ48_000111 [Zasmidium cellare]|uniref:Lectin n=1 Tax=Zasmidium cellare TaxID=395010 RepID=A0ABR0EYY5_ZASCE|nr:hypothetical protein PRZ48_000111 [Zasmidium cellare]
MGFLNCLHRNKPNSGPAHLTFHGPDSKDRITATNTSNTEVARFTITKTSLFRLNPSPQPLCTYKRSWLSGTTTLHNFHGRKVSIKQSWEGMQYGKDVKTPWGTWKWRPGNGGCEVLRDGKTVLARGKLPGRRRPGCLEVFVNGDAYVVDLILASWAGMVKDRGDGVGAAAEVIGAVGGAVGAVAAGA